MWDKVGDDWQNLLSSFFQIHKICPLRLFLLFFPCDSENYGWGYQPQLQISCCVLICGIFVPVKDPVICGALAAG